MFNKKRIKLLEARVALLEQRAEVTDFKEKSNGKKFIVTEVYRRGIENFKWYYDYTIRFLSARGDKVISENWNDEKYFCAKENDKYLEFWFFNEIESAMFVEDDKLVKVDIDIYKKAFADRIKAIQHVVEVKAGAEQATSAFEQMTSAFEQMTSAVEQCKNTAG